MTSTFIVSRQFDAPADRVWELITDTRAWPDWGPSVGAVDCPKRYIAAGSSGRLQTPLGFWLPFVVATFEPGSYWDWRVAGLAATGHRVVSLGNERCRLSFSVPAWAFGYVPVCRLALIRIDRILQSNAKEQGS